MRGAARPGSVNRPIGVPSASKIWTRSRPLGASATTNRPLGPTWSEVAPSRRPCSGPIRTIGYASPVGVTPIHGVSSAVEDVVVAVDRLLERDRLTEQADHMSRQPTGRPHHSHLTEILGGNAPDGGHGRDEAERCGEPLRRRRARR